MELIAPPRMIAMLPRDGLGERGRDAGMRARVLRDFALEGAERIGLLARRVIPSLNRFEREANGLACRRMAPRSRRELFDTSARVAVLGRSSEQRADDRKAQPCPSHA